MQGESCVECAPTLYAPRKVTAMSAKDDATKTSRGCGAGPRSSRLDLREVTELADKDHDEAVVISFHRVALFNIGLSSPLLFLGRLGHEEQIGRAAEEKPADDQIFQCTGKNVSSVPAPDRESHLNGQRQ